MKNGVFAFEGQMLQFQSVFKTIWNSNFSVLKMHYLDLNIGNDDNINLLPCSYNMHIYQYIIILKKDSSSHIGDKAWQT